MTVSSGLLDQRVRLYAYVTADVDGVVGPTYQYVREAWGRLEDIPQSERVKDGALQDEATSTLLVHESTVVPARGLVTTEDGSEAYRIVGQARRRALACKVVRLVRTSEDTYTKVES